MSWCSVPDRARDVVHVRGVRGAAQLVGHEVLGLADEVDGEAAHPLAALGELPAAAMAVIAEESRPPESSDAARDVGDELAARRCRRAARARARPWSSQVVGVLAGLAASSTAWPRRPLRSTVTTVPGSTSRMPSHTAWPGVLTKANSSRSPSRVTAVLGERVGEDRLGLGAEQHAVGGRVVVERLDAHPVADHDQLVRPAVPDREGVHAVEALGDRVAPLQVGRAAPPRCRSRCRTGGRARRSSSRSSVKL